MADRIVGYPPKVTVTGNVISFPVGSIGWNIATLFTTGDYVANVSLGSPASSEITNVGGFQADGTYEVTVTDASAWSTDERCSLQRQATVYWYTTMATFGAAAADYDFALIHYANTYDSVVWYGVVANAGNKVWSFIGMLADKVHNVGYHGHVWFLTRPFKGTTALLVQNIRFSGYRRALELRKTSGYRIKYCDFMGCNDKAIYAWDGAVGAGGHIRIENCHFVGCFISVDGADPIDVYNTTAMNGYWGFNANSVAAVYKNCAGLFCLYNCFKAIGSATVTYCASTDWTADDAGGAGHLINQTIAQIKTTHHNCNSKYIYDARVLSGSTLIGAGNATAGIDYDIDGQARSDPPAIGCSEGILITDPDVVLSASGGNWEKADKTKVQEGNDFGVDNDEVAALDNDNILSGVGGNWTKADKTKVQETNDFGIGGTSEVAALDNDNILDSVGGAWTKADKTKVQAGNDFGIGGVSEVAALSNDYISNDVGGNYDDDNLTAGNVKLGVTFGIGNIGTYVIDTATAPTATSITDTGDGSNWTLAGTADAGNVIIWRNAAGQEVASVDADVGTINVSHLTAGAVYTPYALVSGEFISVAGTPATAPTLATPGSAVAGTIAIDGYSGTTMYLDYSPGDDVDTSTLYLTRHDTGVTTTQAVVSGRNDITIVQGQLYRLVVAAYNASGEFGGFTNVLFQQAPSTSEGTDLTVQWISDQDTDWQSVGLDIDETRSRIPVNRRAHHLQFEVKTHGQNQQLVLRNTALTVRMSGRAYEARQ